MVSDLNDIMRRLADLEKKVARAGAAEVPAYMDLAMQAYSAHQTIIPVLRGFWPMTSYLPDSTIGDHSQSGHHLTWTAGASLGPDVGRLFNVISVNGIGAGSGVLYRNDGAGLDLTGSLALGGWFKITTPPGDVVGAFISKWGASGARSYILYATSTKLLMLISSDGASSSFITEWNHGGTIFNRWVHLVGSFHKSNHGALYVDGVRVAVNTTSVPAAVFNSAQRLEVCGYNSGVGNWGGMASMAFLCASPMDELSTANLYKYSKALFGHK